MTIEISGRFYKRYKEDNSNFNKEIFACAENAVSKLLSETTTSERPLMLLGKVQSGKTRTYISIIALALDNKFDVAVVLSKNSKALLEQTLQRLQNDLKIFVDENDLAIQDIMQSQKNFTKYEIANTKQIFVAKKEANNLKRLLELFKDNPEINDRRVLFIDDEADNASIGYSKKDNGQIEARKIAKQISDLRTQIKASSYIQVTATPYSLYLQPSEVDVTNVKEFKPTRPLATVLVPIGDGYVGGEFYFGPKSVSDEETIERLLHYTVNEKELELLKKHDGRSIKLSEVLTSMKIEGYRTAIINFITASCIQRINGKRRGLSLKKLHYSFLLHTESLKNSHEWQETLTKKIIESLKDEAEKSTELFNNLITKSYSDLERSLLLDKQPVPEKQEVISKFKEALVQEHITINIVNSDKELTPLLDIRTGQFICRTPLNIFLGGQTLDRGVTLVGLIGFYYGRRPKNFQQDTVLQHSRMYGYRSEDIAVTRFYTSKDIRYAMGQMEEFDSSLREAIERGTDGAVVFIRRSQDGKIRPCSPNKILISKTQTIRPGKRILPIAFQTGPRTGINGISRIIEDIDREVESLCGYQSDEPVLVTLDSAIKILNMIQPTLIYEDIDDPRKFDWDAARAALSYLSQQHKQSDSLEKVWLWAAKDRNLSRKANPESHVIYIETPDSKTEAMLADKFAINSPILFLLRQNGDKSKGWRDTPFYWPVIRAQRNTPIAIYAAETND